LDTWNTPGVLEHALVTRYHPSDYNATSFYLYKHKTKILLVIVTIWKMENMRYISLFIGSLLCLLIFSSMSINTALAEGVGSVASSTNENAISGTPLTYENTTFGIKIDYPSNWIKLQPNDTYGIVNFDSPDKAAALSIIFINGVYQNIPSIEKLLKEQINDLKQTYQGNIRITEIKPVTLSGMPTYEVVYDILSKGLRFMQIFAVQNSGEYVLTYVSSPSNFSSFLPTVRSMLQSIQIANINQRPQQINENQIPFSTFQNSSLGIKIQYPTSWEISGPLRTKNGTLSMISFTAPIRIVGFSIITLNSSGNSGISEDDANDMMKRTLIRQNGTLISLGPVTLANGDPGYKMIFTHLIYPSNVMKLMTNTFSIPNNNSNFTLDNNPIKYQQTTFVSTKADKPYIVTWGAAQADYSTYEPIAQKMLNSLYVSPRAQTSNPTILGTLCSSLAVSCR
jgi:hypothetical protein